MSETIIICPHCGTQQPCMLPLSPNNRITCTACGESFSPSAAHIKRDYVKLTQKIATATTNKIEGEVARIQVAFKRNGFGANPIWGYLVLYEKTLAFELDTGKAALFSAHFMDFGNTDEGIAIAATWSVRLSEISDIEIGTGILNATLRVVCMNETSQEFLVANRWKAIGPMRKFRENILRLKGL